MSKNARLAIALKIAKYERYSNFPFFVLRSMEAFRVWREGERGKTNTKRIEASSTVLFQNILYRLRPGNFRNFRSPQISLVLSIQYPLDFAHFIGCVNVNRFILSEIDMTYVHAHIICVYKFISINNNLFSIMKINYKKQYKEITSISILIDIIKAK